MFDWRHRTYTILVVNVADLLHVQSFLLVQSLLLQYTTYNAALQPPLLVQDIVLQVDDKTDTSTIHSLSPIPIRPLWPNSWKYWYYLESHRERHVIGLNYRCKMFDLNYIMPTMETPWISSGFSR